MQLILSVTGLTCHADEDQSPLKNSVCWEKGRLLKLKTYEMWALFIIEINYSPCSSNKISNL
jgi:hypothetical protein